VLETVIGERKRAFTPTPTITQIPSHHPPPRSLNTHPPTLHTGTGVVLRPYSSGSQPQPAEQPREEEKEKKRAGHALHRIVESIYQPPCRRAERKTGTQAQVRKKEGGEDDERGRGEA